MSTKQNDDWLEAAQESLDYNIEEGDYQSCLAVITDVRVNGFAKEAESMRNQLREVPLEKFITKTPYDY